jgi:membrane-bound ClpP family serine protease
MATMFLVGVISLVVAAVSLALDGTLDLPDSEWLSTTGVFSGVAMFCFVAGTMQGLGAPMPAWIAAGAISALIVTGGTSFLIFKLRKAGSRSSMSSENLLGSTGSVTVPIEPGGFGQINLAVGGETLQMNAVSDESIAFNQSIRVVGVESPTCVRVENLR